MLHNMLRAAAGNRGGWTPADTTTDIWLDPSDSSTVTIATGVSNLADKSGNSRDAAQATASYQPALSEGGFNGLDALSYDGSDDTMSMPIYTPDYISMFAVVRADTLTSTRHVLRQGFNDWSFILRTTNTGSAQFYMKNSSGTNSLIEQPSISGADFILCQTYDGATHKASVNGSVAGSNSYSGVLNKTIDSSTRGANILGGDPRLTFVPWNSLICEVIIKGSGVSDEEREKFEGYLAHKWGVESNLPPSHPYKISPP